VPTPTRWASALWAFLDADYHRRPHAALMGQTPRRGYLEGLPRLPAPLSAAQLAKALEVSVTRRVRNDCTFDLSGTTYEVDGRHLAGKRVTVIVDGLTDRPLRATWQDQALRFGPCDPVKNCHRKRGTAAAEADTSTSTAGAAAASSPFDPVAALLQKAREVSDE